VYYPETAILCIGGRFNRRDKLSLSPMVNSCVRCCCGTGCAICWIVIGIWGFFFLGIIALLFKLGKTGNIGHYTKDKYGEYATTLLITWIIYIVLTIACGINLGYRLRHPFPEEEEDTGKKDQFSGMGGGARAAAS
jgi:hypothetical protein